MSKPICVLCGSDETAKALEGRPDLGICPVDQAKLEEMFWCHQAHVALYHVDGQMTSTCGCKTLEDLKAELDEAWEPFRLETDE